MNGDFVYKPLPGDWELPPEAKEALGPVAYALLSEGELEGVPIGVGFQASKDYAALSEFMETESDPDLIVAKIKETRSPWEERYPGAAMWDRAHGYIALGLAQKGHLQEALDLISTIVSPYEKIARVGDLESCEGVDINAVIGSLMADVEDDAKRSGLIRALRDHMIDKTTDPDMVNALDRLLVESGVETDAVVGWVESRKIAEPRLNWAYAEHIAHEDVWPPEMAAYWKRYVLLAITETIGQIDRGEIASDINGAIGILDDFESNFGDAKVWDQLRAGLAMRAFAKDQAESAMLISLSVRDPELIASLTVAVAEHGNQDAALELATSNPNPAVAVDLLLDVEWEDEDVGVSKLSQIVQDDTQPKERRITMMKAVRDRFTNINALDMAVKWQDMIDELKEEG